MISPILRRIAAQDLTVITVRSWPTDFPVTAGASAVPATVSLTNGINITFDVAVSSTGVVTVTQFKYDGILANTYDQT